MVINRAKSRRIDSNSLCGKVEDVADYLGMDTDREQHKLVHWRHRRSEGPAGDTAHCTDRSHSHKPGKSKISVTQGYFAMDPVKYTSQFDFVSNAVKVSLKYPGCPAIANLLSGMDSEQLLGKISTPKQHLLSSFPG